MISPRDKEQANSRAAAPRAWWKAQAPEAVSSRLRPKRAGGVSGQEGGSRGAVTVS